MAKNNKLIVWHTRDTEGYVGAVYATPKKLLDKKMDEHIEEEEWEYAAGDDEDSYYDDPETGEPIGSIHQGVPGQPFGFVHVVGGNYDNCPIDVKEAFGDWGKTPDSIPISKVKVLCKRWKR